MNYEIIEKPSLKSSECLIIGLLSDVEFPKFIKKINKDNSNIITTLQNKIKEKTKYIWQHNIENTSLMLINCGKENLFNENQFNKCLLNINLNLSYYNFSSSTIYLPNIKNKNQNWQIQQTILEIENYFYEAINFKIKNKTDSKKSLKTIRLYFQNVQTNIINISISIADGIKFSRTLSDLPSNKCTPYHIGHKSKNLEKTYKQITTKIIKEKEIEKIGMRLLTCVSKGSTEKPCFIEIKYTGSKKINTKPIILVGKGITFDSGGISLKPANFMDEMKYDMTGASCVLGVIKACANLNLPINIIGLIASAENMPSGSAMKPGDIIKSLSGKTIEITNTDAEGRLILADTLTYAERFNPEIVIDIATLTGAIITALGNVYSGFMTNDEILAKQIIYASEEINDKIWRLPIDDEQYKKSLKSSLADMVNSPKNDRNAGAITAACFLSKFTKNYRWAHIDIAGTAWKTKNNKNISTGRPVALLVQFLYNIALQSTNELK
ncbi:leucyl aminopeptidase [Candidatus Legionella polyplacis]|uniref:Probable cytosol aminopeptidase n=1 Tax=Candidatus Legionella polyplacis TaxID=2005262 RepID=A0ABZ2GV11_9GAMM